MSWLINYDCTDSILCWWNRGCYKNTIRIKNALTSICNSWSVFQEGGKKFVLSETRLHIVKFSKTKSRRYCINGNSKRNCWGECPSELRVCSKNWKVPGWNPTRRSAWLKDPQPRYKALGDLRVKNVKYSDWHRMSEAVPKLGCGAAK